MNRPKLLQNFRGPNSSNPDSISLDLPEQGGRPRFGRNSGAILGAIFGLSGLRADAGGAFSARGPDAIWRLTAAASRSGQRQVVKEPGREGAGRRLYFSSCWQLKKGRVADSAGRRPAPDRAPAAGKVT